MPVSNIANLAGLLAACGLGWHGNFSPAVTRIVGSILDTFVDNLLKRSSKVPSFKKLPVKLIRKHAMHISQYYSPVLSWQKARFVLVMIVLECRDIGTEVVLECYQFRRCNLADSTGIEFRGCGRKLRRIGGGET